MRRIAVTQRIASETAYPETRDALDVRWGAVLAALDCLPILLPSGVDPATYFRELRPDGVLFTGGNDLATVSPGADSRRRDAHELRVLALALEAGLPVVGVCRGLQLLATHFGAELRPIEGHVRSRHRLMVSPGSRLREELSALSTVNSYHSYGLDGIGGALVVSARAEDGSIEAIEHPALPVFGQMWHPEREEPLVAAELGVLRRAFGPGRGA